MLIKTVTMLELWWMLIKTVTMLELWCMLINIQYLCTVEAYG